VIRRLQTRPGAQQRRIALCEHGLFQFIQTVNGLLLQVVARQRIKIVVAIRPGDGGRNVVFFADGHGTHQLGGRPEQMPVRRSHPHKIFQKGRQLFAVTRTRGYHAVIHKQRHHLRAATFEFVEPMHKLHRPEGVMAVTGLVKKSAQFGAQARILGQAGQPIGHRTSVQAVGGFAGQLQRMREGNKCRTKAQTNQVAHQVVGIQQFGIPKCGNGRAQFPFHQLPVQLNLPDKFGPRIEAGQAVAIRFAHPFHPTQGGERAKTLDELGRRRLHLFPRHAGNGKANPKLIAVFLHEFSQQAVGGQVGLPRHLPHDAVVEFIGKIIGVLPDAGKIVAAQPEWLVYLEIEADGGHIRFCAGIFGTGV